MILRAPARIKPGIFEFFFTRSVTKCLRLLNGLSKTATLISGLTFKYLKAVTAPMDLPHIPIYVTLSFPLKYLNTSCVSFHSKYPSVTYYPSAFPHPQKSNVHNEILFFISSPRYYILHKYFLYP
jgi:hypothetical protein